MSFVLGRGRSTVAAGAVLTAAVLGLTACGGSDTKTDDSAQPAAAGAGAAQDCVLVGGPAIKIPSAISYYKVDGKQESLKITNETPIASLLTDPAIKKLNDEIESQNKAFSAATDDAARNEILPKSKKTYEDFLAACESTFDANNKEVYKSYLDYYPTTMPKPEVEPTETKPAAPVEVTKVGTTVKVGDTVIAELTDGQGRTGPVKLTVTKVEVAPEDDKKFLDEDSRDQVAQLVYVNFKAENAEPFSAENMDSRPSISDVHPDLDITTNDGSDGGFLMSIGGFGDCEDGSSAEEVRTFCKPFPLATKTTKVSSVKLTQLTIKGEKNDDGLYTWTN